MEKYEKEKKIMALMHRKRENPKQIKYVNINITTNYTWPSSFVQQVYDP